MFKRSFVSKDRAGKTSRTSRKSYIVGADKKAKLLERSLNGGTLERSSMRLNSAIITIVVGKDHRLFAAHEDVLCRSPFFKQACKTLFFDDSTTTKRLDLSTEEPETFSLVLEYLYKGDYSPRLIQDKRGHRLEGAGPAAAASPLSSPGSPGSNVVAPTLYHSRAGGVILRDTAVYCAGEAYGLEELKRLALRKQGLQIGIEVAVILRSMRFAYDFTPDTDSRLRAHYLALVVRSRKTFKRSGTMQHEMAKGGAMFFDLFVAMCNHLDDLSAAAASTSPKTI